MIRQAHHDDDDDDDGECGHHHHHDHDDDECCHHHHHDEHDEEDEDGHEHHHHHGEDGTHECCCHHDGDDEHEHEHEHHHHHHGHDADEIFQSWGVETPKKFTDTELRAILSALDDAEKYGVVLRAKGIVESTDGSWIHFDHVPGEIDVRSGTAAVTGRLCVIGSKLNEAALAELFGV